MLALIVMLFVLVFLAGLAVGERKGVVDTEQRWHDSVTRMERVFNDELSRVRAELHSTRIALRNHLAARKA